MKVFIFKSVIFTFPLLLLVAYLEIRLAGIPNSYNVKKKYFTEGMPEIELLIVGNSHAYFGINPELFARKTYNMANASQTFYYDAGIISNNLGNMKSLMTVIIPVSYFSFGDQLADSPEEWRCFFYERYYNIPPGEKRQSSFLDLRKYSLIALYGGVESFRYMLKGFKVNLADHVQQNGWNSGKVAMNPINPEGGRRRVLAHHANMAEANYDRNIRRLDDLFALLRQNRIEPVMVTTPVYHTYYDNLDPARVRKMEESIQLLSSKYHVRYYNYLKDKRFSIEDFSDNDHLGVKGAAKFSKILNENIFGAGAEPAR